MAAATENEGSGGYLGWNPQSGGPLRPGVPPLEESLAAHLLLQTAGWTERRRPLPPQSRDRERLVYLDKIFKYFAALPLRPPLLFHYSI